MWKWFKKEWNADWFNDKPNHVKKDKRTLSSIEENIKFLQSENQELQSLMTNFPFQ